MRTAVVVVCAGVCWLAAAGPVWGHAAFVASQPEPGSSLAAAPGTVRLRFTEPLIQDLSFVAVTDPLGQTFRGGPTADAAMKVDVDSAAPGTYVVEWKTVSPIDGHTLTGRFTFGVGADVGPPAEPSDRPGPGDLATAIARTLEYAGLLGTIGLLTLAALAAEPGNWRPGGLHRWVVVAAIGGVATVGGEVLLASSGSAVAAARGLLATPTGQVRLLRLAVEVLTAGVAVVATRRSSTGRIESPRTRATILVLAMVALAAVATSGHGAASSYGTWIATGHLWTAAVWAGTILAMALHRPPGGWRSDLGRQLAREFTPIALAAFTATAVLGIVRGVQELAHPADLWSTSYGQVLVVKVSLVAAMAILSLLVWRRSRHHPRAEAATTAGVVLLAAVLVAFPVPPGRAGEDPAAEAAADTNGRPQPGDLTIAQTVDATVVGLSIRPGEPGVNDLFLHLVPPGGEQADEIEVSLTVDDGSATATRTCGEACRVATAPLEPGTRVTFELGGLAGATGSTTFIMPDLPAPDGTDLVQDVRDRMHGLTSARYDEVLGPAAPPVTSTWELVFPDRLHGTIQPPRFRETIRIADRWWNRTEPDAPWTEPPASGDGLSVRVDQFLWDVRSTNHRLLGMATVDGVQTRIVAFYTEIGPLPIWYRLWVDGEDRVRRAVMLTQGHHMRHRYYDFGAAIRVEPPVN